MGKLRYDLMPPEALQEIVKVLTYGADKYGDWNWVKVPNPRARYYAAAMRHLQAYRMGEIVDGESGLRHLAHAACSLIFLLEKEMNEGLVQKINAVINKPLNQP